LLIFYGFLLYYFTGKQPLLHAMRLLSVLLLILIFAACGKDIAVDERMNGISETEVVNEFGAPKTEYTIYMTKGVSLKEYQSNLYNIYPHDAVTDTVEVRELHWYFRSGDQLAIWLEEKNGQWTVVDNLRWSKDVVF